jgi:hypothetical protein
MFLDFIGGFLGALGGLAGRGQAGFRASFFALTWPTTEDRRCDPRPTDAEQLSELLRVGYGRAARRLPPMTSENRVANCNHRDAVTLATL